MANSGVVHRGTTDTHCALATAAHNSWNRTGSKANRDARNDGVAPTADVTGTGVIDSSPVMSGCQTGCCQARAGFSTAYWEWSENNQMRGRVRASIQAPSDRS